MHKQVEHGVHGEQKLLQAVNLHEGNALLGLLVEQSNALLKALLVSLPGLQQLGLFCAVSILDCSGHIHVLHGVQHACHFIQLNWFTKAIL